MPRYARHAFHPPRRTSRDWRCSNCDRLLGRHEGERIHLKMDRAHEYLVSLPATATCRGCGALNELRRTTAIPARTV